MVSIFVFVSKFRLKKFFTRDIMPASEAIDELIAFVNKEKDPLDPSWREANPDVELWPLEGLGQCSGIPICIMCTIC